MLTRTRCSNDVSLATSVNLTNSGVEPYFPRQTAEMSTTQAFEAVVFPCTMNKFSYLVNTNVCPFPQHFFSNVTPVYKNCVVFGKVINGPTRSRQNAAQARN